MIYTFTTDELAYVREAQEVLRRRLQSIVEIHRLQGLVALAPDGTGLVAVTPLPAQPGPVFPAGDAREIE